MVKSCGQRPLLCGCNRNTDDKIDINNTYPSIERVPAAKFGLVQTGQRHFPLHVFMPSLRERELITNT